MASIADLGSGVGYIYAVNPDDTSKINIPIVNDDQGARAAKLLGLQSANVGANLRAVGSITIDTVTGTGNITAVTINGINQIKANIGFTVATTTAQLAALVEAQVNSYVPASGVDYTAIAVGNIVYLMAPASAGDSVNGHVLTVTISANATASVTDVDGGTESYTNAVNSKFGYRFFIDPTDTATFDSVSGDAVEITNFLCTRGFETGIPILTPTISSGAITIERQAAIQYVIINGEGSASDTLTTINPVDFADGDQIICLGISAAIVITIDNTGNIVTQGGTSFVTGDFANMITLSKSGSAWYEVSKSTTGVPTAAQFRTANFPLLSTSGYGSAALTAADNTTVTLTANTSKQKQVVTGTVSLTTGNYTIAVSTTDAKAGDEFIIEYNANVTVGSYDVIIGGVTLTDADALSGGIVVMAYYSGSAWQYTMYKNYNDGAKVQTADIATSAVTVSKLETGLKYETIIVPVSFTNPAENKIRWAYSGTVVGLTAYSTSLIGDDSTITPKNTSGTIMGSGTLTFSNGDPVDTGVTSVPATNNTFVSGDYFSLLTQTSTLSSGTALVTITVLRS